MPVSIMPREGARIVCGDEKYIYRVAGTVPNREKSTRAINEKKTMFFSIVFYVKEVATRQL